MKWIKLFSILILFSISYIIVSSDNTHSKDRDDWYTGDPSEDKDMIEMDDELLGIKKIYVALSGLIYDSYSQKGIANARVSIIDPKRKKILLRLKTNKNGRYSLTKLKLGKNYFLVKAQAKGYASVTKSLNLNNAGFGLDFGLPAAQTVKLLPNEQKTITDPTNNAQLTIHARTLKRIDNAPVKYPVYIKLGYINPNSNLESMPGVDMLSESPSTNKIKPLLTIGAVIIEGYDNAGVDLRLDRKKERKLGISNELKIKVHQFMKNGQLPKGLRTWDIDFKKGASNWQKTRNLISKPSDQLSKTAALFPPVFLKKYARDLAGRINGKYNGSTPGQPEESGIVFGRFNGNKGYGDEIRLNSSVQDAAILAGLAEFMLLDIYYLTGKSPDCLEFQNGENEGLYRNSDFVKVFDVEYDGKWFKAGSYFCKNPTDNWLSRPNNVNAKFDYSPLLKLVKQLCLIMQYFQWQKAVIIKSVDLIPFNLDIPTKGTPILIKLRETKGDGKFKAFLRIESKRGNFSIVRFFNSPKKLALIKVLVPEKARATLKVIADFNIIKPKLIGRYKIPTAKSIYRWDSVKKNKFVDSFGKEPKWILLGEKEF